MLLKLLSSLSPFHNKKRCLPFVRATVVCDAPAMPLREWLVGDEFVARWVTTSGSRNGCQLVFEHASDPGHVVWASCPGRGFVSAAVGTELISDKRGSFQVDDVIHEVLGHQTVDEIEVRGQGPSSTLLITGWLKSQPACTWHRAAHRASFHHHPALPLIPATITPAVAGSINPATAMPQDAGPFTQKGFAIAASILAGSPPCRRGEEQGLKLPEPLWQQQQADSLRQPPGPCLPACGGRCGQLAVRYYLVFYVAGPHQLGFHVFIGQKPGDEPGVQSGSASESETSSLSGDWSSDMSESDAVVPIGGSFSSDVESLEELMATKEQGGAIDPVDGLSSKKRETASPVPAISSDPWLWSLALPPSAFGSHGAAPPPPPHAGWSVAKVAASSSISVAEKAAVSTWSPLLGVLGRKATMNQRRPSWERRHRRGESFGVSPRLPSFGSWGKKQHSSGRWRMAQRVNRVQLTYESNANERFFGFGEQFSYFDMKGRRLPIIVQEQGIGRGDQPITFAANLVSPGSGGSWHTSYAPVPHYITSDLRSLMVGGHQYTVFDMQEDDAMQVQIHGNSLSGRIFHGRNPLELIERYTSVIGRMPAPPGWLTKGAVVGLQGGTERVVQVLSQLQARNTPLSAVWLQDWVGQRKTAIGWQLWWNWELDRNHYPGWDDLVAGLNRQGVRVLGYCNPFLADVNSKIGGARRNLLREAMANGYLVRDSQGDPYVMQVTTFDTWLVDLTNPSARHWLKAILTDQMAGAGLSGWMADFGEALPFDAILYSGEPAALAHNKFPELWAELNREVVEEWQARARAMRTVAGNEPLMLPIQRPSGSEESDSESEWEPKGCWADDGGDLVPGFEVPEVEDVKKAEKKDDARGESREDAEWQGGLQGHAIGKGQERWEGHDDPAEQAMARKEEEDRLVFFVRAGFRSSPGAATLFWLGDQVSSWQRHDGIKSAVTGLLSGGVSGFSISHSDIGGYAAVNLPGLRYCRSEELLMRWTELNAFTAVFRTHEGNLPESNAQIYSTPTALDHFSRMARVFAAWGFYRRQLLDEAKRTGAPVVRHLFLHFPRDPQVHSLIYQEFLVGSELLVAPVLDPGRKHVSAYLPGTGQPWVHLWTQEEYGVTSEAGGQGTWVTVEAPIGQPAVFFQRNSQVGARFVQNLYQDDLLDGHHGVCDAILTDGGAS